MHGPDNRKARKLASKRGKSTTVHPHAPIADGALGLSRVLEMIEHHGLAASGVGYVDAQLLASTLLVPEGRLWTRDARLAALTVRLNVGETLH